MDRVFKPYNVQAISRNIQNVFASGVDALNEPTYHFISLYCGFSAHYNLYGFRNEYRNLPEFAKALLTSELSNDPTELHRRAKHYGTQWFVERYGQPYVDSIVKGMLSIEKAAKVYLANADIANLRHSING